MTRSASLFCSVPALAGLLACAPTAEEAVVARADFTPDYGGIQTVLLDGDLVNFHVTMRGARDGNDALIRGFGFARHVRTSVAQTGGNWRGDAVYTISASLPKGSATIDAEVTVRDCGAQGIPTI
jgi:hypothetical protein